MCVIAVAGCSEVFPGVNSGAADLRALFPLLSPYYSHRGRPQVLIVHKTAQVPAMPEECSNRPILTMEERVVVVRNLLEHFVAHGKTSFTPAVFPRKRESYNPKIGVPTQVVGERYKWFVLSPLGAAMV